MAAVDVTLVVASYNQPNALALVLEGILRQEQTVDEIVFADDGSQDDTVELVDRFRARAGVPVVFTTQEDRGFRKAMALNNAIRVSHGESLLFLDGDCIPPPRWARCFVDALRKGADFATGGYVWMDLDRTRQRSCDEIAAGKLDDEITAEERAAFRSIHRKELFYRLIRKRKKPKILGGNWAVSRAALVAVNGFDEGFDNFGKEDSDVRNRLQNAGFRGVSLWDRNWVYHCSHDLDPRRNLPEVVRDAPDLDYYLSRVRATRCERGLTAT